MNGGIEWLLGLPRFRDKGTQAYKPGLERMHALMAAMNKPHKAYPIAHVAGTNGKGSTSSMIAAIGTASGRRIGLHTSPHLIDVTERLRIDGVPAPRSWVDERTREYRAVFDEVGPSFFEATVALSLLYFAEEDVDAAVIEVGLGGRLDATNIVTPEVSVITSIALEHTDVLGDTIEAVAREKAGIIKPGVPVVSGLTAEEGAHVVRDVAAEQGSELIEPDRESGRTFELDLQGLHQQRNASLAVAAAGVMWPQVTDAVIVSALRDVCRLSGLRGRLEQVHASPDVFADVSHNADGISVAIDALRERYGSIHVVLALMSDKDAEAVASRLGSRVTSVHLLELRGERIRPFQELWRILEANGVRVAGSIDPAELGERIIALADDGDVVLATGSHLVAAKVISRFG